MLFKNKKDTYPKPPFYNLFFWLAVLLVIFVFYQNHENILPKDITKGVDIVEELRGETPPVPVLRPENW